MALDSQTWSDRVAAQTLADDLLRRSVLTTYFIDGIHQRGPTYDRLLEFEKVLKKWPGWLRS
jgi:hypothetical protein